MPHLFGPEATANPIFLMNKLNKKIGWQRLDLNPGPQGLQANVLTTRPRDIKIVKGKKLINTFIKNLPNIPLPPLLGTLWFSTKSILDYRGS